MRSRVAIAGLFGVGLLLAPVGAQAQKPTSQSTEYSPYEKETIARSLAATGMEIDPLPEGKTVERIETLRLEVLEDRDPIPEEFAGDQDAQAAEQPALRLARLRHSPADAPRGRRALPPDPRRRDRPQHAGEHAAAGLDRHHRPREGVDAGQGRPPRHHEGHLEPAPLVRRGGHARRRREPPHRPAGDEPLRLASHRADALRVPARDLHLRRRLQDPALRHVVDRRVDGREHHDQSPVR